MLRTRTIPFYESVHRSGNRRLADCLRRWLLWRLVLLLLSVLFLSGLGAGVAFLLQLRAMEPAGATGGGSRESGGRYQVVGFKVQGGSVGGGGGRRVGGGDGREYLASNLSVLLAGGWPASFRFHPATFPSVTDVLNKTVHCDRPTDRDTMLVYGEPTWVCKNIRIADLNWSPIDVDQPAPQRLPFSDTTSRTLEEMMLNRQKELLGKSWSTSGDACGLLPDRRDNVLLLCEMLLAGLRRSGAEGGDGVAGAVDRGNGTPPASSVHIPFGNCSLPDEKRILLVGMATEDAVWYTENAWKPGFVTDLFCSFAPILVT